MKATSAFAILFALLASTAFGVGQEAVAAYTFVCTGKKTGPCPNGGVPNSLIQATDGNFYGTTANSGDKAGGQTVFGGTVFSLTPAGTFTLLHTFVPGSNGKFANGAGPVTLTEGPDGKLYGLTAIGGINYGGVFYGYGVLFRINKSGSGFQVIHKFCSVDLYVCTDGSYPAGGLVVGSDNNIYGATLEGGGGVGCASGGCGTIFRVTPSSGAYKVVFNFGSSSGGGFPGGLTPASDGTFYGLTIEGGSLFHFTPATTSLTSVTLPFSFPPGCPGFACFATNVLSFGTNGNLYGFYTVYASTDTGLFEVETSGEGFQLFPPVSSGVGPELLLATDGNFWFPQSTASGSADGDLVALSPSTGTVVQTLTPFSSSVFGPAQMIQGSDGTLWGVAAGGAVTGSGHFADGAVFSFNAGLPPR
jgi:uncharacterized repeat protein (TIGR03803 family)